MTVGSKMVAFDFLIFSDQLSQYWDIDSSVMIAESMNDLRGGREKILDKKVKEAADKINIGLHD